MPINGSGRFIGPGQPIRDGLIGWYDNRYKEPDLDTGNNWVDISGNNKDLTANSSPGWSYGYYFEMDGSDDYFRTTSLGSIGANYSIEWWGDGDADTSVDYVFDWRSSSGTNYVLKEYNSFDTNMNNVARINWSNGYQNWHQVAATHNGTTSYLYINGELAASGTGGSDWTSGYLTIGTDYNGGNYWNGKVGCVRAYNRLLSATEIRHNFMCDAGKFGITIEGTS